MAIVARFGLLDRWIERVSSPTGRPVSNQLLPKLKKSAGTYGPVSPRRQIATCRHRVRTHAAREGTACREKRDANAATLAVRPSSDRRRQPGRLVPGREGCMAKKG